MPATPPPPLPSAAITARRRDVDALLVGQMVAIVSHAEPRGYYMMQSEYWHTLLTVYRMTYDCSRVDTDFSEGIRNDVRCREEAL